MPQPPSNPSDGFVAVSNTLGLGFDAQQAKVSAGKGAHGAAPLGLFSGIQDAWSVRGQKLEGAARAVASGVDRVLVPPALADEFPGVLPACITPSPHALAIPMHAASASWLSCCSLAGERTRHRRTAKYCNSLTNRLNCWVLGVYICWAST